MAIENAIVGSILTNYNLIKNYNFNIIGEQYLKIEMHLMAYPGVSLKDVRYVRSHPMAIAQCNEFLAQHPHLEEIESNDTASCAKQIKEQNLYNNAAIANQTAAEIYGLNIIKRNIENDEHDFTRFLILAKSGIRPDITDKASVCFELDHEVGTLADVLNILKKNNVNVSKIQSVPIPEKPKEYTFHADLEWRKKSDYNNALGQIIDSTKHLKILGEYARQAIPE